MSYDRTNEFFNVVSIQGRTTNASKEIPRKPRRWIQSYSDFMVIMKNIGKNTLNTYAKLEKFALLIKKKPIFHNEQIEIVELTDIIKKDLRCLNLQIGKLQESERSLGFGPSQRQIAAHCSSIVMTLRWKLTDMSDRFESLLKILFANMREEQSRTRQFTQCSLSIMFPPSIVSGSQTSLLPQKEASNSSVAIDIKPAMSYQLMQQATDTDADIQSSAESMPSILKLGSIFRRMVYKVKEQEMVKRISGNVKDTELNVEAAYTGILKYFRSVTSDKQLRLLAILIYTFIYFVLVLALLSTTFNY